MNHISKLEGDIADLFAYFDDFLGVLIGNGEPTGLDVDIESFMIDYVEDQTGKSETERSINVLIDTVFSNDRQVVERVIRYFLGRGKGLTPSGDDHVIGLLAIHMMTDALSPVFVQTVNDLVKQEPITTDAGHGYLLYALNGEFLPPIASVVNDLAQNKQTSLKEHLHELLPMGHSSGVDTAFGILIGLLALKKQISKRNN